MRNEYLLGDTYRQ